MPASVQHLVIVAGGKGTRLAALAGDLPKVLLPIGGKPVLQHQLELAATAGIRDVTIFAGYLGDRIREFAGDGSRFGLRVRVEVETEPLGNAGALLQSLDSLPAQFFVLYGDSYLECDYEKAARAFAESGCDGLMTVYPNENRWDSSNVEFRDGRIVKHDKKDRTPGMRHIDYGLGVLKAEVFDRYPADQPLDLTAVYQDLIAQDKLAGLEVTTRFYEIGSFEGLKELREYVGN